VESRRKGFGQCILGASDIAGAGGEEGNEATIAFTRHPFGDARGALGGAGGLVVLDPHGQP
jgi:hypothetical protein